MVPRVVVLLLFTILLMCSWMMVYIIDMSNNVNYLLKEVQELELQLINDGHIRDAQANTIRKDLEQEQAREERHHQINPNVIRTKEILPTIQLPEKGQKSFANQTFKMPNIEGVNVVSMSLWGSDGRYTNGALANAELIKVFFPGWTLRIYTESSLIWIRIFAMVPRCSHGNTGQIEIFGGRYTIRRSTRDKRTCHDVALPDSR